MAEAALSISLALPVGMVLPKDALRGAAGSCAGIDMLSGASCSDPLRQDVEAAASEANMLGGRLGIVPRVARQR